MKTVHRSISATVAALGVLAGTVAVTLLAGVAPAGAAITHEYLSRITEVPAEGPAHEPVALPGPLRGLPLVSWGAGHLYVTDRPANSQSEALYRVDEFDGAGAFVAQTAHSSSSYEPELYGSAAGREPADVYVDEYVNSAEAPAVGVYSAAGVRLARWSGAQTPAKSLGGIDRVIWGIAADNSTSTLSDPAAGDVYVPVPAQHVVDIFHPEAGGGEHYVGQLPEPELEPGVHVPFGEPKYVAVDEADGDVLVTDRGVVDEFEPVVLGEYRFVRRLTGTPAGAFSEIDGVAVDGGTGVSAVDGGDGDIYVLSEYAAIDQFGASGAYLGKLTGTTPETPFNAIIGVAVDPASHDLYVGARTAFGEEPVFVFGPGIAMPDVTTAAPAAVKATGATLMGTVNPDEAGEATCRFAWGTTPSLGESAPCEPEAIANGGSAVPVHAVLSALQPDTTYYYRLQATNKAHGVTNPGEAVQDQHFTTPGPGIHAEFATAVTSTSAILHAQVDAHGAATTYYFQYGTGPAYGTSVPLAPGLALGAGEGDLPVTVQLQGLSPATTYHYRVVALAEPGGEPVTVDGADETFSTQAGAAAFALPDNRAWEMVSPPNKHGAGLVAVGYEQGADIQAAADGGGITYVATAPFVEEPAGSRALEATQVMSTRQTPGVWRTEDITTPHTEGASPPLIGKLAEYKLFSSDLSLGLVEPIGVTPLAKSPSGSEKTLYLREADGEFKALITPENVPPGAKYGGNNENEGGVQFINATPDLSHLVLEARPGVELTEGYSGGGLYEWSGGKDQLVSVLPENGGDVNGSLGYTGSSTDGVTRHAISNDGSRVVWEHIASQGEAGALNGLYLRDLPQNETIRISAAQEVQQPANYNAIYQTANDEGSRVFFLSDNRLTAKSTARSSEYDLYVFELTSGKGEPLAGKLTDLTVDPNAEEGAQLQHVIGASENGSYVYFVANGVLGDGAEHGAKSGDCHGEGSSEADATCNLYVVHYDEATHTWAAPSFIATLSGEDWPSWGGGETNWNLNVMTSRVSPNGRYLAFMSDRSLTGYDNRDANSGVPDEEVFLYDALTGHTTCASCNPTGARPVGVHVGKEFDERLVDYDRFTWEDRWLAGSMVGWDTKDLGSAVYEPRNLANSGRLFFESSDALVPADVNGEEDVYEYEPSGIGGCQGVGHGENASVVFNKSTEGCVGLISAGTSSEESVFLDASETGGDVFFITQARLAPQDYDTSLDVYDAHECSAAAPCAPAPALTPPPCTTGDACKPGPTPQPTIYGAPSSETFTGAGNIAQSGSPTEVTGALKSAGPAKQLERALKACQRKARRKRAGCEAKAKRRYGAKRSRAAKSVSATAGRQGKG